MSSTSHKGLPAFRILFSFRAGLFDRVAGRGHKSLFQGRHATVGRVTALQFVRSLQRQYPAVHHDADAVAELLGLAHVVGAEQDRGVVRLLYPLDEDLDVLLATWVEARRRLVEE